MKYDPIQQLAGFFEKTPFLQKVFYKMLDLLLLRTWHIHRELKQWARNNPGHKHILDAGSGFGQYTYFMASKFPDWSILGVDFKAREIAKCNEFFRKLDYENVLLQTGDLTEFEKPDTFDLVLSVNVMEYIRDDAKVFENLRKSLKAGGMLLISTPSDQGGPDVYEQGDESSIGEYAREGYGMKEIKEKLKSAGFSKVKARYSYGAPGKVSWKLSMRYPMLMLNISKALFAILPLYYLVIYPICFVLNYLDSHTGHTTGTGLIVKAWK